MYFEDIEIGTKLEIPERVVEEEEMLDFARKYNGSFMHTDQEYAAKSRLGKITAAGTYTYSLMWGYYAPRDFCGHNEIAGTYTKIEYKSPVYAGDRIHGEVYVFDKKERNPYNGAIYVRMDVYNQDGKLVLTAEGDDIVERRPLQSESDSLNN